MKTWITPLLGTATASILAGLLPAATAIPAETAQTRPADGRVVRRTDGPGSYAVVVSERTYRDAGWQEAADTLVKKHQATLLVYSGDVNGAAAALAEIFPRYACFVASPKEATRPFVVSVHRLTRKLDGDPYTDLFWGILTGYDAADALRIARHGQPLLIQRGAGGTDIHLDAFEEGVWFSEGEKGARFTKREGKVVKETCADDSTAEIVEALNRFKPQIFITSGHATPADWQIGYSYRNGQFRCRDGRLFGLNLAGQRFEIDSPEPKVYLPAGNCLMGLIPDRQAMALAWMHSGGAYQMIGYVVSTFFGYGGWGTRDYFIGQAGRFTYNEAFIANNIALVHELESRFPAHAKINIDEFDIETDRALIPRLARKHRFTHQDELGLLWDRDTVAFYGDPAWAARMAVTRPPAWRQTLTEREGVFTLELTSESASGWGSRPAIQFFPRRLRAAQIVEGAEHSPVVTDTFVLIPTSTPFGDGKTIKVVIRAP